MTKLRRYISRLHAHPATTFVALTITTLLWPLSLLLRLGVALQSLLYKLGVFRSRSLPYPVISIGNLTTGGTGKTPVALLLADRLGRSLRCAVLSRGYGSDGESRVQIYRGSEIGPDQLAGVGDEIELLASRLPDCWFGIGADRFATGTRLARSEKIQVAILDDGFQHRRLARNCDIVLIDATNAFGNGLFLPAGPLREGIAALKRSQVVLLTRCESADPQLVDQLESRVAHYVEAGRIFRLRMHMVAIRASTSRRRIELDDRKVWLFSGIGNPGSFENLAVAGGVNVVGHMIFPDHHGYSPSDIEALKRLLTDHRAEVLLTTDKDAVKIQPGTFAPDTCCVLEIGIDFVDRADIFWGIIAGSVGAEI
jgi:tetraacyldisaccharide 4'-kinase